MSDRPEKDGMRIYRPYALSVIILLFLAGCAATTVSIQPREIGTARIPDRPLTGSLTQPSGTGPFPAMVLLHTCAPIGSNIWRWQQRLMGWGYAVLVLDSFGARGVSSACGATGPAAVTATDRAGDAVSAALFLRSIPGIDADRIGVIGMSQGGATAALVVQSPFATTYPGAVEAAIDYYGPCGNPSLYSGIPLLALAGERDTAGYPAASCQSFGHALKPGQPFEVHTYPDAVHGFDNPYVAAGTQMGYPEGYDPAAAEDSFVRVRRFLDQWLRKPGTSK